MPITPTDLYAIAGEALALWMHGVAQREVHLTPTGWLAISGEPHADLNVALVDEGPQAAAQLRAFHQMFQARGVPAICSLTPAVAAELAPIAQALGLQSAGKMPFMVYDAADIRSGSDRYVILRVASSAELAQVNQVLAEAFAVSLAAMERVHTLSMLAAPGLTLYLAQSAATDPGQPEGTGVSTVATVQTGPVIGVWAMGTAPAYQRQGAGYALLTHVMAEHCQRGAQYFYLMATPVGKLLYERIGFRTLTELDVWVTADTHQPAEH